MCVSKRSQRTGRTRIFGSGALPNKMLLVRIIEKNDIDTYFRYDTLSKC